VRRLDHIKKLDDCFGMFIERIQCKCGHCRDGSPKALAAAWCKTGWPTTLAELFKQLRCSKWEGRNPEVFATPEPRPRGHGIR
jgi:hypothetical protein